MTKSQLIKVVAKKAALNQKDATRAVDAVFDAIKESVNTGEPVAIIGFGTWKFRHRKAYVARNPANGEPVNVPAKDKKIFHYSPSF